MHPRFDDWIDHVFNHPVMKPQWHFDVNAREFQACDADIAQLITETFENSGKCLNHFSDAQVDQGVNYLVSPACSDFMFSLRDGEVTLEQKLRGIDSIFSLYKDCFYPRCSQTLSHLNENSSPLNPICYMFWDLCPINYLKNNSDQHAIASAIFSVLDHTLQIQHKACIEGALHGLGHMVYTYPHQAVPIIDRYLSTEPSDIHLKQYAEMARTGCIQ